MKIHSSFASYFPAAQNVEGKPADPLDGFNKGPGPTDTVQLIAQADLQMATAKMLDNGPLDQAAQPGQVLIANNNNRPFEVSFQGDSEKGSLVNNSVASDFHAFEFHDRQVHCLHVSYDDRDRREEVRTWYVLDRDRPEASLVKQSTLGISCTDVGQFYSEALDARTRHVRDRFREGYDNPLDALGWLVSSDEIRAKQMEEKEMAQQQRRLDQEAYAARMRGD